MKKPLLLSLTVLFLLLIILLAFNFYSLPDSPQLPKSDECDSPDIQIGNHIISACNVGTTKAGTGEEAYGTYYTWEEAQTVCPSGYHLPSIEERQGIVKRLRQENPSYGTINRYGDSSITITWSKDDLERFKKRGLLPLAGLLSHDNESFYDQEEEGYYWISTLSYTLPPLNLADIVRINQVFIDAQIGKDRGLGLSVRCFKNSN